MNIIKKYKPAQVLTALAFIAIVIFAFNLRSHTFNLPHYRGDQQHYVALAYKLDAQGISGYNLRGINIYGHKQFQELFGLFPADDKGSILKGLEATNITYYDQPLHHIPFGFPAAIMLSHKIFADDPSYSLLAINDVKIIQEAPPGVGLRNFKLDPEIAGKQFYSIIVPLFFSMLLIVLVYFLAKILFGKNSLALTAMFLMTISPIDILTAQKVWADDMTSALVVLAVLLYVMSIEKKMPLLALAGGIACGISAVTKQSGAFLIPVIIIWHFAANFEKLRKKETFLEVVFDKNLLLFGLGTFLGAGYWFIKVYSVYGNPVYRPHQEEIAAAAKTDWFKTVGRRPRHLYLAGIPYQNPLFALAYISPLWLWLDKARSKKTLLLIVWIVLFLFIFQGYLGDGGKEHRYMLPAYPAFAILGAYIANLFRVFLDKRLGFYAGTVLLAAVLVASACRGIPMAYETLFHNGALIMKPF